MSEFKKYCFFCEEDYEVEPDTKHPDRFEKNPDILRRAADRDKDYEEKEIIQRSYFGGIVIYQHYFS